MYACQPSLHDLGRPASTCKSSWTAYLNRDNGDGEWVTDAALAVTRDCMIQALTDIFNTDRRGLCTSGSQASKVSEGGFWVDEAIARTYHFLQRTNLREVCEGAVPSLGAVRGPKNPSHLTYGIHMHPLSTVLMSKF